jgi:hypothetical protein
MQRRRRLVFVVRLVRARPAASWPVRPVHLHWSASAACPAVRPCLNLNLSVHARARLVGFGQGLRPRVQRRFRVRARASPCLGQGLCGRRSSSPRRASAPRVCVQFARARGSSRQAQAACLFLPPAAFAPPPRPCGACELPRLPCRSVHLRACAMPSRPAHLAPSCACCSGVPRLCAFFFLLGCARAPVSVHLSSEQCMPSALLRAPRSPRPAVALSGDGAAAPCSAFAGVPRAPRVSRWTAAPPRPFSVPASARFCSSLHFPCCGEKSKEAEEVLPARCADIARCPERCHTGISARGRPRPGSPRYPGSVSGRYMHLLPAVPCRTARDPGHVLVSRPPAVSRQRHAVRPRRDVPAAPCCLGRARPALAPGRAVRLIQASIGAASLGPASLRLASSHIPAALVFVFVSSCAPSAPAQRPRRHADIISAIRLLCAKNRPRCSAVSRP